MHPNIKLARKFSKYYPPIELPADKNDWHIGQQCLAMLEDLYPRRDLLITTLLDSYEIDRRLENIRIQKREIGHSTTMQQTARRTSPAWMKRGISSP